MEKGIFDRFFNGYLLGKRKMAKPFKYLAPTPYKFNRYVEAMIFPKNKFEKVCSNFVERSLPTIQYFCWNEMTSQARQGGWTIQEKLFHNYFRNKNIQFHAHGQHIHPYGYLERQRADAFFRRVQTILPGCELPEWAQESKRVPNFDFESVIRVFESYQKTYSEATPSPHYNTPNYFCIQHLGNQRFYLGFWGQRLFFNEEIKGSHFNTGKYSKEDIEMIDSWYGDCRFNFVNKVNAMSEEEKQLYKLNIKKWSDNIDQYYPEFKDIKVEEPSHKYDEPHFERNMEEIRDAIYAKKCMDVFSSGVFNQSEIQQIYEFFLGSEHGHDLNDRFFYICEEDGLHKGTPLYEKFIKEFNMPDIFQINRIQAKAPEEVFVMRLDKAWGINYYTVDNFRRNFTHLMKKFNRKFFDKAILARASEVRTLVMEEAFSPMFKNRCIQQYGLNPKNRTSVVLQVIRQDANNMEALQKLSEECRQAFPIAHREVRHQFQNNIKEIIKTRPYDPASL